MFARYSLRTIDVDGARRFYAEAIGLELPEGSSPGSALELWPLHERARARGAPPHWLGQIAVADADAAVNHLVEAGAESLGPPVRAGDGSVFAMLRGPEGEIVAVRAGEPATGDRPVAWHQLHAQDAERAWSLYVRLFDWRARGLVDVPDPIGGHRLFGWDDVGAPVGSIANTARWPGVHPHWLFYFPVRDAEDAAARVRALGGTAMEPMALPDHTRLCACEDPQGAAFGLLSSPP
jgi:uncharacterized protein